MRLIKIILLVFFVNLIYTSSLPAQKPYLDGRVIIKFKQGSLFLSELMNGGYDSISDFEYLIGKHRASTYVDQKLLIALEQKTGNSYYLHSMDKGTPAENLSRIYVFDYEKNIDPAIVAGKLSEFPGIEYAEPAPRYELLDIPNDPYYEVQYYLEQINAIDSYDFTDTLPEVILGIVDTGVDYEHEDLAAKIYENPGETGTDNNGDDKRSNGRDDDNNGFIDDWRGWDFVSSTSNDGQDNDPYPGNMHGTHVSGTAAAHTNNDTGIAGIAVNARILPVKIGQDNSFSRQVINSFDGLLYAGIAGADVINCSWGSNARSEADQEIITTVEGLGSLVVAAAGNDGDNRLIYPAGYDNVLSVASVNPDDRKSFFSNYHTGIDISAPGEDIYSTVPDNQYEYASGTSMATPVTAGVAALARAMFPGYSPLQLGEHLKATADPVDTLNFVYEGMIGKGRVNVGRALDERDVRSVIVLSHEISDESNDGILDIGEKVEISLEILNVLNPVKNLKMVAESILFDLEFIDNEENIGDLATGQTKFLEKSISFIVPDNVPLDYNMLLKLKFTDDSGDAGYQTLGVIMRPSYRTMDSNNISVTLNSVGNIGYNDYPSNTQGIGYRYKGSESLLYEGSVMVAVSEERVSDNARSAYQIEKNNSFFTDRIIQLDNTSDTASLTGVSEYFDTGDTADAGVRVLQKTYQFNEPGTEDFIIVSYDIINESGFDQDSLFAGLFFDWDIGPGGRYNKAYFDDSRLIGFMKNIAADTLPLAGVMLLSAHLPNYYAIDNDSYSQENPGIYDGFTRREKWKFLSGGIARQESEVTDASMVIGAGPIELKNGDTTRVSFSIFSAYTVDDLRRAADNSREIAHKYDIANGPNVSIPAEDSLIMIYPNPAVETGFMVDYAISRASGVSMYIYDALGRKAATVFENRRHYPAKYTESVKVDRLAQGKYFLVLETGLERIAEPFTIVK